MYNAMPIISAWVLALRVTPRASIFAHEFRARRIHYAIVRRGDNRKDTAAANDVLFVLSSAMTSPSVVAVVDVLINSIGALAPGGWQLLLSKLCARHIVLNSITNRVYVCGKPGVHERISR